MERNIIKIDEEGLKNDLKGVIRKTIEETLSAMLDEEAAELCNAERHERTDERKNNYDSHYRVLQTSWNPLPKFSSTQSGNAAPCTSSET